MNRNTRWGRALRLALLTSLTLAIAGVGVAAAGSARLEGTVNINTATHEELQLLPGVGESRAMAVIALREQRGGLKSVEELKDVKGIGDVALERIRPFVATKGKTTARIE
jgi:competence protein ComEA